MIQLYLFYYYILCTKYIVIIRNIIHIYIYIYNVHIFTFVSNITVHPCVMQYYFSSIIKNKIQGKLQ